MAKKLPAEIAYDYLRMNPGVDFAVQDIAAATGLDWRTVSRALGRSLSVNPKKWPGLRKSKKVDGVFSYHGEPLPPSDKLPALLGLPLDDLDVIETEPEPWEVGSTFTLISKGDHCDYLQDINGKIWAVEHDDPEDFMYKS